MGGLVLPAFFRTSEGQYLLQTLATKEDVTTNEDFWATIRQAYIISSTLLDLNNGGLSPQAKVVQDALERHTRLSNEAPSYYMWRVLIKGRERVREKLAELAGCAKEEIAINRNATEALGMVILGLDLAPGDEVVVCKYDYPTTKHAWLQRERRDGIVLKWVDLDLPNTDEDALANAYIDAFTKRTKVVFITHMLNWSGQILPVRKIAQVARDRGIQVVVDGAQTFAQIQFSIPDLACDYFGTSLHKWLGAPYGTGMLYVKRDKIASLHSLFGHPASEETKISKFEHLGTRSFAVEQAIGQAIHFHEMIGMERKEKRLRYLSHYWVERVKDLPNIKIHTPMQAGLSCALVLVDVKGKSNSEIHSFLDRKKFIHTTTTDIGALKGIRISPNVHTSTNDMDRLVQAFKEFCK